MKIKRVDHLGIAVGDIAKASALYRDLLGFESAHEEILSEMKLKTLSLKAGGVLFEFLQPLDGEETISKFLKKHGPGFHHICFEVEDVREATTAMIAKGMHPVWDKPRKGAEGRLVNFLRPSETGGLLIEFSEENK